MTIVQMLNAIGGCVKVHPFCQKPQDYLYRLYKKYKDRDFVLIIPLVLLALEEILSHILWLLSSGRGLPQCADSKWYLRYADTFVMNLTDGLDINDVLYFGYNTLLALLLTLFKDPVYVIFLQAVTASFSVILVFKIARMLFNRPTAVLASVFYYKAYDIKLWATYLLSDSFFISLQLLCVYLLLLAQKTGEKHHKIMFALAALYMLVFRPTGVISLAFILIYIASRMDRKRAAGFIRRYRLLIGVSMFTIATTGIFLYAGHKFDPLIHSLQYNAKMVLYNIYAKGWIYDKPTPHDHFFKPDYRINICNSLVASFIINNWEHVAILYGKRAIAFLGHWVWVMNLSTFAGIVKFAWFSTPVVLFLVGTMAALRNGVFRQASVVWLVILAVFLYCIFLFMDWMYRYRAPAVPFIVIVIAYGTEQLFRKVFCIAKNLVRGC
ncbi:MAG: glycosyltransferase family 39 protein [Negativicutes bacterium]|nr:glycosyltransferase family 39 protein [Negativicutes bacterium]